jgi:hypothetical protein
VRGRELSYRRRRRLVALIVVAVVAGGVSAAIVLLPRGEKPDRGPTSLPPRADQSVSHRISRRTHLSVADQEELRSTIALFVSASVARHHPERSWSIVHPILREGLTKRQWRTGEIPVVPYPAVGVDLLRLQSVVDETALAEVVLEPARNSHLVRKTFQIELRRLPRPPHQWLVSSWVPEGVSETQMQLDARSRASTVSAATQKHHLAAAWIFLPLGALLAGLILVPAGLFVREAYRFRRAEAKYRSSLDDPFGRPGRARK